MGFLNIGLISRFCNTMKTKVGLRVVFSVLLMILLTGCATVTKIYDENTLRGLAADNMKNSRYKTAAENYFMLWCQYPNTNKEALLDSAQAYIKANEGLKAIDVLDDYMFMRGSAGGKAYLWKAFAYYSLVKNPWKNLDKAEKALLNLEEYKKISKGEIDLEMDEQRKEYIENMEKFLKDVIAAGRLLDASLMLNANPPSYIAAMKAATEVMEKDPGSEYAAYAEKIYDTALENLGLNELKN